jgi:formylglycine-generating enzyme required for sulfatase activity
MSSLIWELARWWQGALLLLIPPHTPSSSIALAPSEHAFVLTLQEPGPIAVYLPPLSLDLGSSDAEVLLALLSCKREPLPDRCDEGTFASEVPLHREQVAGFWMARTEVTVRAYDRCVASGHCNPAGFEGGAARFRQPNFPVTMVSFEDASRYCRYVGGALPSEAQFERAARGKRRRIFPWGNLYHGRVANHGRLGVNVTDAEDGFVELAPVGSFPDGATPEGILDLAGNVEEWTSDLFTPAYGLPPSAERTVRGGHYGSAQAWLRGAVRSGQAPDERRPTLGFRCVWTAKPL